MEAVLYISGWACIVFAAWTTDWHLGLFALGAALIALAMGFVWYVHEQGEEVNR